MTMKIIIVHHHYHCCSHFHYCISYLGHHRDHCHHWSYSPPESQWSTLQVLLCFRCLGFEPHPRIVGGPWSNVCTIVTLIVVVMDRDRVLIVIEETSEGCCTGSKMRWRLVQEGKGGSTKKLSAFLWKFWKLLRWRKLNIDSNAMSLFDNNRTEDGQ